MLDLNSPRWTELQHAYGSASDIPHLLRKLEAQPVSEGLGEPWFTLWSSLAHQGDVYSASFAAVPHIVRRLATAPAVADGAYFQFPAWVEICRHRKNVSIPQDLLSAYLEALAKLPVLVAAAAAREWDDGFLAIALSALAVAKGGHEVAEAVLELTPVVARDFMEWFYER